MLLGYFTPRAFSVIEITEQVYLGVLSSSLKIELHSKLTQWSRRFPSQETGKKGGFAVVTGLGQGFAICKQCILILGWHRGPL